MVSTLLDRLTQAALEDGPGGGFLFCCCFSGLANNDVKRASAIFTNRNSNEDYLHFGKKQNWDEPQQRARRRTPGALKSAWLCTWAWGPPLGHSTDPEPSDPTQHGRTERKPRASRRPPTLLPRWARPRVGGVGALPVSHVAWRLGGDKDNNTAGWVPKEKGHNWVPFRPLKHLSHPSPTPKE